MPPKYEPDLAYEVTLWESGSSSGTISIGLGINRDTGQLLFYLGDISSNGKAAWWMVAERHLIMLYFFLDHRIYFDGQADARGSRRRRSRDAYDIHFSTDEYQRFQTLLDERIASGPDRRLPWISPKKLYALVEVIALMIEQMDYEAGLNDSEFEDKWDNLQDMLEREVSD